MKNSHKDVIDTFYYVTDIYTKMLYEAEKFICDHFEQVRDFESGTIRKRIEEDYTQYLSNFEQNSLHNLREHYSETTSRKICNTLFKSLTIIHKSLDIVIGLLEKSYTYMPEESNMKAIKFCGILNHNRTLVREAIPNIKSLIEHAS